MNILLVVTGLNMGGAENLVTQYADEFFNLNHIVTIVYLTGDIELYPKNKKIQLKPLHITKNPLSLFKAIFIFHQLIKEFKPDVIHSHLFHANILSRFIKLLNPNTKLICSAHNTHESGWFRSCLYRFTDFIPNITTNASHEAVDVYIDKQLSKSERIIPVYNGIDTNKFLFNEANRVNIRTDLGINIKSICLLSVGRLTEQKNYPLLLNVISKLIHEKYQLQLLIAGNGPDKEKILQLLTTLNISKYVTLLGNRSDIPSLMSACDMFILPSSSEGFGLVVAEAMACNRFVIATDCGGVKEVMGDYGCLIPPNNEAYLYAAIKEAIITHKFNKDYNPREYITSNFSMKQTIANWIEIYNKY